MKKKTTAVLHDVDEMEATPSAMKIPEILQLIFGFNDQKSNCNSNVLVCKTWSDPCMNVIWREVTDISRLARILGDITTSSYSSQQFANEKLLNWSRFLFYARRVHILQGTTRQSLSGVFEDIAYQRPPSISLLPNLKVLGVNDGAIRQRSRNLYFMLMEPTLEEYHLQLEERPPSSSFSLNLQMVAERCPQLKHVDISLNHADNALRDAVVDFIERMPNLTSICLSAFSQMDPVTSVLRIAPNLKKLAIGGHRGTEGISIGHFIKHSASALPAEVDHCHFVSLTTLGIVAPYSIVAKEFLTEGFPSLRQISISSDLRKPETPSNVKHLLESLVEMCPRMEILRLSYSFLAEETHSRFPAVNRIVQAVHLKPILMHTNMRSFKFEHPFPVKLEDEFAEEIATSWPHLRELRLAHTPVIRRQDFKNCFTLYAFLSFARHCLDIEYLALLIAPQSSTCPTAEDITALPTSAFGRLGTLDVGFSMLYECDSAKVASVLGQILLERCFLHFEREERTRDDSNRFQNWKSVKEKIPGVRIVAQAAKLENERWHSRLQELEIENQRLRAQLSSRLK